MASRKKNQNMLSITEGSDFQYLLELMLPLYREPGFAWLPELFSTVGYESLIKLCKYAGGEVVKIPTIEQLSDSIEALDWYYKVWISKKAKVVNIPTRLHPIVKKIAEVYDARNSQTSNSGPAE